MQSSEYYQKADLIREYVKLTIENVEHFTNWADFIIEMADWPVAKIQQHIDALKGQ